MKPDMSKSNAICDISSPSFLTPTTLKNITQILESEECMKSIQTFEETGDADKAKAAAEVEKKAEIQKTSSLRTRSRNTYFNLGGKSWQVRKKFIPIWLFSNMLYYKLYGIELKNNLKIHFGFEAIA